LALFAVGWVLAEASGALLLVVTQISEELEPEWARFLELVLSVPYLFGVIYFLTGIGMSCLVPAPSRAQLCSWGALGCLIAGGIGWALFNLGAFHNQKVRLEFNREVEKRISALGKATKGGPPPGLKAELERLQERFRARAWAAEILRTLMMVSLAGLCGGKLLFTGTVWAVARHFGRDVLASGLIIYLVAEAVAVVVVVFLWTSQQPQARNAISITFFTGTWPGLAITSAYCAWFLVYLFQVRNTVTRGLVGSNG
jgi:hypothetical protein